MPIFSNHARRTDRPRMNQVRPGYAGSAAVRRSQTTPPIPGRPGHTVVGLRGEFDIASAPALREHLLATLDHSARLLILDLGEVSFCDAAGLAVLIGIRRRAAGLGITVRLANPCPQIIKLLRITRLDRSLAVHTTMPEALVPAPSKVPSGARWGT